MELKDYREIIDDIDREMVRLFLTRMDVVAEIARYKEIHGLPILQADREQEKLTAVKEGVPEALKESVAALYALMLQLSRQHQAQLLERKE